MAEGSGRQWSGKTGGFSWQQRALVAMMRHADIRIFYAVMGLVIPFYMLFSHKGYLAAYRFFRQRLGYGRIRSFAMVYRNHFRFGQVILDRFAAFSGVRFKAEIRGADLLERLSRSGAVMMAGSHVGNYEMAGYLLGLEGKPINAVVFAGESDTMMENRRRMLSQHGSRLIPIKDDMSHLLAVNEAIERGEVVSMHADRSMGSAKKTACEFFGGEAMFPTSVHALALRRKIPIAAVFVMKEKAYSYSIYLREICPAGGGMKPEECAARFAAELETMVRRYPEQWFNYYDFWQK